MSVKDAYNIWANQYDTDKNKTRDLEAIALRTLLSDFSFENSLEAGCGTGKNTGWLHTKTNHLSAVDFSEEMIAIAKTKINSGNVRFQLADINDSWDFADRNYDLVTFSLILEHIENLDNIFRKVSQIINPGGIVYVGELHPFRQYSGTKANFNTDEGKNILTCYVHNISDFFQSAKRYGFSPENVIELFDDDDRSNIPRILAMLLKKE